MLKLLLLLFLSLNLSAACYEAKVWWDAEVLWDKAAGKVCEIGAEQLLYVFDPKTNQRSEFFKSVESAIEQGEDLSKFFGKEMGPEERRKAKDEALAQGKDDY